MGHFASETEVSVEKSRAELETILTRYGANRFGYMTEPSRAIIGFTANNRTVRFTLPLPDRRDERFWNTPAGRRKRTETEAYRAWEQACRTAWRALCLCVKAKLEACESGITSFEAEFLAHFVLPNGQTFGEHVIPQLPELSKGQMPKLLLNAP